MAFIIWSTHFRKKTSETQIDEEKLVNKILVDLGKSQHETESNLMKQIYGISDMQMENLNKFQMSLQDQMSKGLVENLVQTQSQLQKAFLGIQETVKFQLDSLSKTNQERLNQINTDVQLRLDTSFAQHQKSFEQVSNHLGQMQVMATKMIESTTSVDKLNTIFARTSSKAFGNFSENYLESLLSENLSHGSWSKQVQVPESSDKIDFVIYLDDKKIGVDSKFPLTSYQDFIDAEPAQRNSLQKAFLKGVCAMADSINKKYNRVGFLDSLIMYLPSDSMYSEVVNSPETMDFLRNCRVTPTSPVTIFPVIIQIKIYQGQQLISQNAHNIIKGLGEIRKNVENFQDEFRKLGDKIRQAQDNYDKADKNLIGVVRHIDKLEYTEEKTERLSLVES